MKCEGCRLKNVCKQSRLSWIFFLTGLVATVAMRIIEPVRTIDPLYAKLSWYVGVGGFFIFFVYKYKNMKDRSKLIRDSGIKEKLVGNTPLKEDEYLLLAEIVCSQDSWRDRTNYLVIFGLSAVAIAAALYFDLIA